MAYSVQDIAKWILTRNRLEVQTEDGDYISNLKQNLATLEAEKETLMATADMCHKQPTKTSDNAFRLEIEHFFARVITGQLAKTLEELDAEEAARKEARKASAKARKANKANSTK